MNTKITIAIDGFSSTGKSTIAKHIAKKYNYIYVDTGAMYRAVALFAFQKKLITNATINEKGLKIKLNEITLSFRYNKELGFAEMFLNNVNVEKEIRSLKISQFVSKVAKIPEVRKKLVQQQQQLGKNGGIVMDGRDIGTVVFPNAELKFFLTATAEERATRRYNELISKGEDVSYEDILYNVQERDRIDSTRKDSPLVKAKDAIEIDNSNLGVQEQLQLIYKYIDEKIN